jgi:hypothetical protein
MTQQGDKEGPSGTWPFPAGMPTWASWSSQDGFLPANFHLKNGPKVVLEYLKTVPTTPPPNWDGMEQLLLLLGLTAREVWRSVDLHEGHPEDGSPDYLKNNLLTTEEHAHDYLEVLYGLSPFSGYKVPPKGLKRKADGNPSGARYVNPHCPSQVIEVTSVAAARRRKQVNLKLLQKHPSRNRKQSGKEENEPSLLLLVLILIVAFHRHILLFYLVDLFIFFQNKDPIYSHQIVNKTSLVLLHMLKTD